MDYPIYKVTLQDFDEGLFATSLVQHPATESSFIYFNEQGQPMLFATSDEEKREVIGAVLVPDKLIFRRIEGKEFFISFSAEVIAQLSQKMHENGYNRYFTISHELDARNSVTFLESWIKETENDKSVAYGIEAPLGTLFMKVAIKSDLIWKNIKDGTLTGFSAEINASMIKTDFEKQKTMDFNRLFKNSLVVGENTLLFNELKDGELVAVTSNGETSFFEGNFEHEASKYTVVDGKITVTEPIVVEAQEQAPAETPAEVPAVVDYSTAINALNEKLDAIMAQFSAIKPIDSTPAIEQLGQDLAAFKLELSQQRIEEEVQKNAQETQVNLEFNVNDYKTISSWGRK